MSQEEGDLHPMDACQPDIPISSLLAHKRVLGSPGKTLQWLLMPGSVTLYFQFESDCTAILLNGYIQTQNSAGGESGPFSAPPGRGHTCEATLEQHGNLPQRFQTEFRPTSGV